MKIWRGLLLWGGLVVIFLGVWGWYADSPRWPELWALLSGQPLDDTDRYILLHLRLPRMLLGLLAGSMLAISGLALQGLFRNPLLDPFLLGISGGGALGAGLAILLGFNLWWWYLSPITFFAFGCGLLVVMLVYGLGKFQGQLVLDRLLLAGVALSALCSSLLSLVLVLKGQGLDQVVFWIMGSLAGRSWQDVLALLPFLLVGLPLIMRDLHTLNILQTGEEAAFAMGVRPEGLKIRVLIGVSLLSASVVAICGVIGFVGLMVPHMASFWLKSHDFKKIFLTSLATGGALLLLADALARNLLPQQEIPVGIFTALLGVPFFLLLLRRH